jgi:hypothetical protein
MSVLRMAGIASAPTAVPSSTPGRRGPTFSFPFWDLQAAAQSLLAFAGALLSDATLERLPRVITSSPERWI